MERIYCILIGYAFGLFQTAFILGKIKGIDIRKHGSGNSGTTNTLRTLGIKAAAVTFLGDLLKAIIPVIIVKFAFAGIWDGDMEVVEIYAGFGAVLGHNFPFYLKFKGGKALPALQVSFLPFVPWRLRFALCFLWGLWQ